MPAHNASLHQDLDLSPINVDLNLDDLIEESNAITPRKNYNINQTPVNYNNLAAIGHYGGARAIPNQAYSSDMYNSAPFQNTYANLHRKDPINQVVLSYI